MEKQFFDAIADFDTLAIFRHTFPDGDALGSQFGLKEWLKAAYPEKRIVALGAREKVDEAFPLSDEIEDEALKNACAIVLDTGNRERIDDQRYALCAKVIKIDHHPVVDSYGDLNLVRVSASSACEVVAGILKASGLPCPMLAATYLYSGLLTDSMKFSIKTVSAETMEIAAWLAKQGIDIAKINEQLFVKDLAQFRYESFLRDHCQIIDDELIYIIAEQEDYERYGLSFAQAKEKVSVFGGIKGIEVWALFTHNPSEEGHRYNGSLRSRKVRVNDIAADFNGGGHELASGVKGLSKEDIERLLARLSNRIHEAK